MVALIQRIRRIMTKNTQHTALRYLQIFAASVLLYISACSAVLAQSSLQADEYQVKAAFLYKFVAYVDWPPQSFQSPDSALVIGVLGAEAISDNLTQLIAARAVVGRPIMVRKLRRGDSLSGLHVLFVGGSDRSRLTEVLAAAKGQSILTVTESEHGLVLGSVINFIVVDDKVRFDVAPPPSSPDNLKISARLLAVARKVVATPS
jgi:hypothetical protein